MIEIEWNGNRNRCMFCLARMDNDDNAERVLESAERGADYAIVVCPQCKQTALAEFEPLEGSSIGNVRMLYARIEEGLTDRYTGNKIHRVWGNDGSYVDVTD